VLRRIRKILTLDASEDVDESRSKMGGGLQTRFFQKEILPWLFLLPVVGLNVLVMIGPSVGSVYYAFTDWKGLGSAEWIGLANFTRAFQDPFLGRALRNNLKWMALSLFFPPAIALFAAVLLSEIRRGQRLFRAIFFLPVVMSATVAARAWQGIYHPLFGVLPWLVDHGLEFLDISLLGNPDLALYLVYLASLWKGWGFSMVLFFAAMQQVPDELYDAAIVDGANRFQQFLYITLPSIRPTIIIVLIFTLIGSMLAFNFVYIMTRGGPNHSTDVLALRMYIYAFDRFEAGYGASIGVLLTLWSAFVTLLFLGLRRMGWEV